MCLVICIVGNKIDLLNSDDPKYSNSVEISEASSYAKVTYPCLRDVI